MSSVISGVDTLNISGGQFNLTAEADAVWRFLLDNIAAKAIHNANNTGFELPKCHPGTREAIQRDLAKWVESKARKYPIYWLYAPAGSGKTAIAKTLADSFTDDPKRCLASFFFRKTSAHQNTEERFIATIAYQIKTNLPQAAPFITDAIKEDAAIFQKDLQVQVDKLILGPLCRACEAASMADRAIWPQLILIDGLDECSGQDAQLKILDVISRLVRHISEWFPLAVFLSCRPEAHIRGAFHGERLNKMSLKTCLPDKYSSDDDLRKFLVGKFKEVVDTHRHILTFPHDWPGNDVIDQLVSKSSGQFIYASTVMKYIDIHDDNPMERLAIVLGLEKCPDNENPFSELDALYSHILASVKDKHRPIVTRLLQVTLSQSDDQLRRNLGSDRLTIGISSLLDLNTSKFNYSLSNLEGILVEGSIDRSVLKFHHASLSDFLLDETRSGQYFIDISLAHTHFIVSIFHYILTSNDIPDGLTSASLSDEPSDFVTIAIRSVLHRLPFAALNDDLHQMLCCVNKSTAIHKIVHNLVTWARVKSLSRRDIRSWELMAEFANRLEQLSFNDAATLKDNFLNGVKKYVSQEFAKYAEEPLCHLAALFVTDCPNFFDNHTHSFVLSRFLIDDHILRLDQMSLSLEKSLRFPRHSYLLRKIVKEIDYNFKPEAYSATCLCALKCISDLNPPVISPSDADKFPELAGFVSSSLKDIERYLAAREASNNRPRIDESVVTLWHVFCNVGKTLLEKAGPCVELQKRLEENEQIIYAFSHMDDDQQEMWTVIKGAIDGYLRTAARLNEPSRFWRFLTRVRQSPGSRKAGAFPDKNRCRS